MDKVNPEDFKPSKRFYAVLLSSLYYYQSVLSPPDRQLFKITIDACWYRLKSGIISAHIGELWDFQYEIPEDHVQFLSRHDDGRHGGECRSRLTYGDQFWSIEGDLKQQKMDLEFLSIMLAKYPNIPDGWDGWWRF